MEGMTAKASGRALLAPLGFLSGFLAASLGIGGGNLTVPVLAGFAGVPLKRAIGSSLVAVVPIAATAVAVESAFHPGNLRWVDALLLVLGSLPGAAAGAFLVPRIRERSLRLLFAGFLAASAARLLGLLRFAPLSPLAGAVEIALRPGLGFLAGVTSSLFGIGGGIVVVPVLAGWLGVPFHAARATSLAMIVPTTAFAAFRHRALGTLDRRVYLALIPTGVLGAAAGVFAVNALPAPEMKAAFGVFLLLAAARLVLRRSPSPRGD